MNGPLPAGAVPRRFRPSLAERLHVKAARLARWEFWPAWAFYPPVVAYIGARCLRSPVRLPFTAANPGMLASGFVGESKHEVLAPLARNAPELVGEFIHMGSDGARGERQRRVRAFAKQVGYPLVMKPDIGQRGRGVAVIRDEAAAAAYLDAASGDVIVQRYLPGAEFGVFVYRDPQTGRVELLSIVRKLFPKVVGDGRRSLAELIRDDPRARLIAPLLWQRFAERLHEVPAAGETIALVEIGAHCRGSLFVDGADLAGEPLRKAMQQIVDAVPGYHFGRIDLRCPDDAALKAGHGLKVMELNGVTAESAHIYNPGTPLLEGWKAMIRQWRLAIEIGEANAALGAPLTGPVTLFKLWRDDVLRGRRWF
jgi:hypothetical protein